MDIPQLSLSDFKKLSARQIKAMKSVDLTSDGEYLVTISNPRTDYIKEMINELSIQSNSVGGKDPAEI